MRANRRLAAVLSAAAVMGALATVPARAVEPVKLSGCLVQGEGSDGFLLINSPREPVSGTSPGTTAAPGSIGTAGVVANIFYWLDEDDDLKSHIGHRVEVEGDSKGDLEEGQIKIDRKEQWTEVEVKSDGREMKARVPNASVIAGPDPDRKIDVLVRRVDVSKVRMLEASCR